MKASESRKTDRIIVISSAVVGLGLATMAILKANGFGEQFPPPATGNAARGKDLLARADQLVEETQKAAAAVSKPVAAAWRTANAAGRDRGFLVSTALVFRRGADESGDAVVDLDRPEPRLRDAFPNEFWQRHPSLQFEFANVGDLDPDKDFFTTLEEMEFSGKLGKEFNPEDAKSHPPMHFRLRFVTFEEAPYKLKFTSANLPTFSLRHENDDREKRWSDQASLKEDLNGNGALDEGEDADFSGTLDEAKPAGKKGDEGRFTVLAHEEVEVDLDGFKEKKIRITLQDSTRPPGHPLREFQMTEGETKDLPSKVAVFDYAPRPGAPISKREFEKFTLPDTLAPSYVLKSVDAEKAVLEFEENGQKQEITFVRGQLPTP